MSSFGNETLARNPSDEVVLNSTLSTVTPLSADSSFSSGYVDVEGYTSLVVALRSDQPGRLTIEHRRNNSGDADYTEICSQRTTLTNPPPNRFNILHKYLRLTYTNTSDSAQSVLNLTASLGNHSLLTTRNNQVIDPTFDCMVTRTYDPMLDICMNRRSDVRPHTINAYVALLNTSGFKTLWPTGSGTVYTIPTTAETLDLTSSSNSDTTAGTGARTITLYGIDENRRYQTETVTMNGTTGVTTSRSWLGVNVAEVATAGSTRKAVGNISITGTDSSNTYGLIEDTQTRTRHAIFHAQANTRVMISNIHYNMSYTSGTRPFIATRIMAYDPTNNVTHDLAQYGIDTTISSDIYAEFRPYLTVNISGAIVYLEAATTVTEYTNCRATFSLYEVKESFYTST